MFKLILLLAQLTLTFAEAVSDCQTNHGGECHSSSTGCPSGFTHYTLNGCGFLSQCCYNSQTSSGHVNSTASVTCGVPDYNDDHRIVGGTITDIRKYPWQVSVRHYGRHVCGGTLIDSHHVLTAAHCFSGKSKNVLYWTVAMGANNVGQVSASHLWSVTNITAHETYNVYTDANDIALMTLSKPVDLSGPYVKTACLPDSDEILIGLTCTVTGWGKILRSARGNASLEHLREVNVPIISNARCKFYLGPLGHINKKQLCAGIDEGGKDACQGDSGGPMVCEDRGVWRLVGVVSWGFGCAERYSPGIYTRVPSYLQWIHTAINES